MNNKQLLNERRMIDYSLLLTEAVVKEIHEILSELEQKTRSDRISQTEVNSNGKKHILIQERELTSQEISCELDNNNIIPVIQYVKNSLISINKLEYSDNQILELLDTLPHIEAKHYIKTLMNEDNSILVELPVLQELIIQLRKCGYGKPEKYNQIFYFVVKHSINVINKILGV